MARVKKIENNLVKHIYTGTGNNIICHWGSVNCSISYDPLIILTLIIGSIINALFVVGGFAYYLHLILTKPIYKSGLVEKILLSILSDLPDDYYLAFIQI